MVNNIIKNNEKVQAGDRELNMLKETFPQCFDREGRFNKEAFLNALPDGLEVTDETSGFNWLGKNYARMLYNMDSTTVICPDKEHNDLPENRDSQNVYISGDNLDALQHLVKSYAGQVKVIYIDPPYNTGSDGFVYNDKFNFTAEELAGKLGITTERADRILSMTRRGSASHAAWLTFMLPRLSFARDLLTKDGVIFISIDDNEQANLKCLCDEVFGESNYLAMLTRRTKVGGGSAADAFAVEHDYVLVYSSDVENLPKLFIPFDAKYLKRYALEDEIGKYFWDTMERSCTGTTPYLIEAPDGTMLEGNWFRGERRFLEDKENGEIRFLKKDDGTWSVQFKQRMAEGKKIRSILGENEFKSTQDDLIQYEMGDLFSFPKPIHLIKHLLQSILKNSDICIDFFAGSSTTADAILRMNEEDGATRKFIMVQLPEDLDESYIEASGDPKEQIKRCLNFLKENNYPHTLDYIGFERIKRAAAKIKTENPLFAGDLGFKHFTLIEAPQDTLDKLEKFDKNHQFGAATILNEFGTETVLCTWLVADGYGLTADATVLKLGNYEAYCCDKHLYLINPEENFNEESMAALIDLYQGTTFSPQNVVVFGYSFGASKRVMLDSNLRSLNSGNKSLQITIDVRY